MYVSVRDGVRPTVYIPLAQRDAGGPAAVTANVNISVRSSAGSPALLAPRVAAALTGVDRNLAFTFRPLQDRVDASLTQERLVALVTGFFGTLALLLAGLGLYGVTSYAVTRRRAEIGIRMALGAEPAGVVRLVLVRVFVLVALGVIIGTAVSWWSSQFIASLLYDLQPRDAVTLVECGSYADGGRRDRGLAPCLPCVTDRSGASTAGQLSGRRAFANRSIEALHIDSQRRHQSIGRDKSLAFIGSR